MKVLLLEGVHDRAVENFTRHGYTKIERHKKALAGDELKAAVADVHFVGIRSRTRLTAEVVAAAPQADGRRRLLHRHQPDRPRRGHDARHPRVQRAVLEHALGGRAGAGRDHLPAARASRPRTRCCTAACGQKSADDAREVRGKTLGIVGYGNIGTQLSVMAEALGMDVCFYDVVTKLPLGNARMMPTLDELLEASDVVTLHVPETPLTQGMMGARAVRADEAGREASSTPRAARWWTSTPPPTPWRAATWPAPPSTSTPRSRRGTTRSSSRRCASSRT